MVQDTSFSSKVIKGFIWVGSGNLLGQLISWAATIIVIRLLLPSDYGLMAMASTFIGLLTMLSELGIGSSIIQAEKIKEKEIKQIFGFIIVSSFIFWLLTFLMAPVIADFYNEKKLILLIRGMSINFFLIALYVIPQSLLIREMNFKAKVKIDIISQVGAALLSVALALAGMGVWTLVIALIALHTIKAIGFNCIHFSLIRPVFDFKGAESRLKFGITVTGDRLLYYLYSQSDSIIIGRFLGGSILGIYSVALQLASIPVDKILPIINQVSFTSYSRIQNDLDRIKRNIIRSVRLVSVSGFPLFFGMAAVAPEAIEFILGSQWEQIVIPFQIICFVLPLKAMSAILPPALLAINRPRVNLINMFIACMIMLVAFLVGIRSGLLGVCFAWLIGYPIVFFIITRRSLKVLKLPLNLYLSEIIVPFVGSFLMLSCITVVRKLNFVPQPLNFLLLAILFGIIFYACFLFLFKKEEFFEIKRLLKKE